MNKYLWQTDLHMDKVFPWTIANFISSINKEKPNGIFLTGDISNGLLTCFHLKLLAKTIKCPIYFVLGNHDYHFSSFNETHNKIRELCKKYPNLIWMTEADVVHLSDEVALIGADGFYDAGIGEPKYLQFTPDWMLIEDFRTLLSMKERIEAFRKIADQSCKLITDKLEKALEQDYKTIYIMTHMPPWKEATRDVGTFMEPFWLPYNVNLRLGQTIETIMKGRNKRHVTVLVGHTHSPEYIRVSRNIDCQVGKAKYFKLLTSQQIFI